MNSINAASDFNTGGTQSSSRHRYTSIQVYMARTFLKLSPQQKHIQSHEIHYNINYWRDSKYSLIKSMRIIKKIVKHRL